MQHSYLIATWPDRTAWLAWLACLVLVLLVIAPDVGSAEEVLQVKASSGAKLRTLLTGDPSTAKANIILLAGGRGVVKLSGTGEIKAMKGNFLVRTRQLFADKGYLTALVDAPMDRRNKIGLLRGFRASAEHGDDLARVAARLHALNRKPVIVVGTSRGSVSAANLALRGAKDTVSAAVLTSSVVKENAKGRSITSLPLGRIKVPVLFVHNESDACHATLLKDVKPVIRAMKEQGARADLIVVDSRKATSGHCKGRSPHGFLGIEKQMVEKIVGWLETKL